MNVVTPSPEAGKKGEGPWLLSAGRWALTGRQTDRQTARGSGPVLAASLLCDPGEALYLSEPQLPPLQ